MEIIFIRHAKAMDRVKANLAGLADSKRPLTKTGIFKFRKTVKKYSDLFQKVDYFYQSTLLRSRQSMQVLLLELGYKTPPQKLKTMSSIGPDGDCSFLVRKITNIRNNKKILIIGHEPFMSVFAKHVLSRSDFKKLKPIKKGGFYILKFNGSDGQLVLQKNP